MRAEDLQTLTQFGKALWSSPESSRRAAVETLTAVSLLDLSPDRAMEKATQALLERATREGAAANKSSLNHPFYRLIPEERLALAALHTGHWSYCRLAMVLGITSAQVASLVWNARLKLASAYSAKRPLYYPTGSAFSGVHCPEYDPASPWTQKMLDEEMPVRERIFLQNHLMACEPCRKALMACRDLYFAVDSMLPVPKQLDSDSMLAGTARILAAVWNKTYDAARLPGIGLGQALSRFIRRPSVIVPFFVVVALYFWLRR